MTPNPVAESRTAADEARWAAVLARDAAQDGRFVYSVRTTGVYCRPSCPSRRARRENVAFHPTPSAAEAAGFRACRRCRPDLLGRLDSAAQQAVAEACRMITAAAEPPSLEDLARRTGFSRYHLHRLFKARVGITPHAYAVAVRQRRARASLADGDSVTTALHRSGFGSSSRFYEGAREMLGMTPGAYRSGGAGMAIRFATRRCSLGVVLVAASADGICSVLLGDKARALTDDLRARFPQASIARADASLDALVEATLRAIDTPGVAPSLPLDVQGTAFEHRVWASLRELRPGQTASYSEIAARIGQPGAARAVARACASNPVAVLIPCHRVLAKDGTLAGYRWGLARKRLLLEREAALNEDRGRA